MKSSLELTNVDKLSMQQARAIHAEHFFTEYVRARFTLFSSAFFVLVWLNVGACFYGYFYGWSYSSALYYSAQAGLSIGFGALSEDSDISRAYTVVHVMIGSSFIAGAVGLFAANTIEKSRVDWDSIRLGEQKAVLIPLNETEEEREARLADEKKRIKQLTFFQKNATAIRCLIAAVVWLALGVSYGMVYEGWSLITSVYFSVAACSTAGLQAPTVPTDRNDWANSFVTFYIVLGVPIYGMILGQFANLTIEDYLAKKQEQKINKALDEDQIRFAMAYSNNSKKAAVEWEDFLIFSLMRLGVADQDLIKSIKQQFNEVDIDNSGYLEPNELAAAAQFGLFDIGRDGCMQAADFKLLFEHLQSTVPSFRSIWTLQDYSAAGRAFADMQLDETFNEDDDEEVSRREFQAFFNFVDDTKTSIPWFEENGEAWLEGKIKLPLNLEMLSQRGKTEPTDIFSKSSNMEKSELLHFYQWTQSAAGQKWLAENKTWLDQHVETPFPNDQPPLPTQAFLHAVEENAENANEVSIKVDSEKHATQ